LWVSTERSTCWVRTRKDEWGEWIIDSAPLLWTFDIQPAKNLRAGYEKNGLILEAKRIGPKVASPSREAYKVGRSGHSARP
jgi:hypothetical protein